VNCLHCYAATTNGLALCDMCQMKAATIFEYLPIYFQNLARWRPGRAGSRPVPSSREPALVGTVSIDRVSIALDEAGADITTWAQCLADDRLDGRVPASNDETSAVRVACWLLGSNLTSVATLEWCGEMVRRVSEHEAKLRRLTEDVAPGWYAGACAHCQADTFVVPGLTWVRCRVCGSTTYARDHLEVVLTEARGWVAPPKRIAEAIVALVDTELSVVRLHDRIRQWSAREKIEALRKVDADGDEVGPKRYRLGDVMDRIAAEGATRTGVIVDNASPAAS
jgi:hypothetical protein